MPLNVPIVCTHSPFAGRCTACRIRIRKNDLANADTIVVHEIFGLGLCSDGRVQKLTCRHPSCVFEGAVFETGGSFRRAEKFVQLIKLNPASFDAPLQDHKDVHNAGLVSVVGALNPVNHKGLYQG